jgi:methionine sulfoxide reductase catalytic subunit
MSVRRQLTIPSLEPTPREVFFDRRRFLAATGAGVAGLAVTRGAAGAEPDERILKPPLQRPQVFPAKRNEKYVLPPAIRQDLTPRLTAATHNNFYEFLPGRGGPAWEGAGKFEVEPWKVEVTGACQNPMTLDLDALFAFPHEERVYHFRCVERWAMNVPWSGFPLRLLLEQAQPTAKARFVRFETANRPEQMPGIREAHWYPWPYHEALRLDEAMNELAMVVTGVYGEPLLKQHGAPVRIVVPWKYGYKNPKSIVKIELVEKQPMTFWMMQPHEYGFLSNINPNVPHPRWSQAHSYWLDAPDEGFPTAIFNGYEAQVAALYPDEPRTPQQPLREGQTAR